MKSWIANGISFILNNAWPLKEGINRRKITIKNLNLLLKVHDQKQ